MISIEKRLFLTKVLIFCLLLAGISLLLFLTILKQYYLKIYPVQVALIAIVTVFSHLRLMNAVNSNVRRFNTTFLSMMTIKLFVYFAFLLGCLFIDRSNAVDFIVTFLILYFCFTIFEVAEISNFLKKNPKS